VVTIPLSTALQKEKEKKPPETSLITQVRKKNPSTGRKIITYIYIPPVHTLALEMQMHIGKTAILRLRLLDCLLDSRLVGG
jgi:hypothetical protein